MRMRGGEFERMVFRKRGFSCKPIYDEYESRIDVRERLADALIDQGDWDPYFPDTVPAYNMLGSVSSGLGKLQFPNFETLGLFRSLGTALDRYWSTDCFFAVKEGSGYRVVIIDLTVDSYKSLNWMKGVVFRPEAVYEHSIMLDFAQCVVSFFLSSFSDNDRTLFVDSLCLERAVTKQKQADSMKKLAEDFWSVTHPYLKMCHEILGPVDE